jgi:hypothetical protein
MSSQSVRPHRSGVVERMAISEEDECRHASPDQTQTDPPCGSVDTRFEGVSLQKSLQSLLWMGRREDSLSCKAFRIFGSPGRIRTYNPSVNSRTGLSVQDLHVFIHIRTP